MKRKYKVQQFVFFQLNWIIRIVPSIKRRANSFFFWTWDSIMGQSVAKKAFFPYFCKLFGSSRWDMLLLFFGK